MNSSLNDRYRHLIFAGEKYEFGGVEGQFKLFELVVIDEFLVEYRHHPINKMLYLSHCVAIVGVIPLFVVGWVLHHFATVIYEFVGRIKSHYHSIIISFFHILAYINAIICTYIIYYS